MVEDIEGTRKNLIAADQGEKERHREGRRDHSNDANGDVVGAEELEASLLRPRDKGQESQESGNKERDGEQEHEEWGSGREDERRNESEDVVGRGQAAEDAQRVEELDEVVEGDAVAVDQVDQCLGRGGLLGNVSPDVQCRKNGHDLGEREEHEGRQLELLHREDEKFTWLNWANYCVLFFKWCLFVTIFDKLNGDVKSKAIHSRSVKNKLTK